MQRVLVVLAAFAASPAHAEDEPPPPPVASEEPTAADVANAPPPGQESGRLDPPDHDSVMRNIAQGVLVPPRVAVELVLAPPRATLWAVDRFKLIDRLTRILFDETMTYGVYPTLQLDPSYGLTIGARFVHRNVLGAHEHFAAEASALGRFYFKTQAALRSGTRLGDRTVAEIAGGIERRPRDAFYGIGNMDDAIETHHRQELVRARATADVRTVDNLYVVASGALTDLHYSPSTTEPSIETVFNTMNLTGWPTYRNLYGELELLWDGRRYPAPLDRHATYNRGWYLLGYGGLVHQLTQGDDYLRYGGDVQHHLGLGSGPRVLATRVHLEAVSGGYDDVAFTELPQLGGKQFLRGYPSDRFRDRLAVVGSAEYEWDLGQLLMASLFVDVGRVYSGWSEVTLSGMRMGYGLSLQLQTSRQYLGSVSIASSIDGGVEVFVEFDPVFDVIPRVVQR